MSEAKVIRHGTRHAYCNQGCRCEPCRAAQSDYRVGYLARLADRFANDPTDPRHGTRNGYDNYNCRCDRCCAAKAVANGEYHGRGRAS